MWVRGYAPDTRKTLQIKNIAAWGQDSLLQKASPGDETQPHEFLEAQFTHPKLTEQLLCFQGSVVPASQWCETHAQK